MLVHKVAMLVLYQLRTSTHSKVAFWVCFNLDWDSTLCSARMSPTSNCVLEHAYLELGHSLALLRGAKDSSPSLREPPPTSPKKHTVLGALTVFICYLCTIDFTFSQAKKIMMPDIGEYLVVCKQLMGRTANWFFFFSLTFFVQQFDLGWTGAENLLPVFSRIPGPVRSWH